MPRPKSDPSSVYVRELRITPPDGQRIVDWKITDKDFKLAIIAEEGGTDEVRLHYHAYIETLRSESWIKTWIYSIAHCYNGESGNAVFFSRKPHDHTIGYVVKHGHVVVRHGCPQTTIDEWIGKSDEYKRSKEAERKRIQRIAKSFTQQVFQEIVSETSAHPTPSEIIYLILTKYKDNKKMLPSRNVVDTLVVSLLNAKGCDVSAFYLRSFSEW